MNAPIAPTETSQLLGAWVRGWTISRSTPSAIELPNGGFKVEVGLSGHVVRYILPGSNLSEVSSVANRLFDGGTWLKVSASPSVVAPLLPEQWSVQATEYLMYKAISTEPALSVPSDYRLTLHVDGMAATAKLAHTSGELAATARVGISGAFAVFDKVVTEPEHRRRRLGSIAVQALRNYVASKHVRTGVLVATEDGLALYRALGWCLSTPMTAAVITTPAKTGELTREVQQP